MKIYLVRHGLTNYNEAGLCNYDPSVNVFLTETGKEQVKALASVLKDVPFQHIFVSQLRRTQQTADGINKFHNVPISIDARLNDNKSGFEGKPAKDYYAMRDAAPNKWEVRLNGGESIADVKQRVGAFVDDLKQQSYDAVLIVTSKVIIQLFYSIVNNLSYDDAANIMVEQASCAELEL